MKKDTKSEEMKKQTNQPSQKNFNSIWKTRITNHSAITFEKFHLNQILKKTDGNQEQNTVTPRLY